jgi:hypothetical protein
MEKKTFVSACNQFFGRLPGQTLGDFQAELKALDDNDRAYFVKEFAKVGIEVTYAA